MGRTCSLALMTAFVAAAPLHAQAGVQAPARGAVQRPNTVGEAVATPLEDVNLKRTAIPDVLRQAGKDPYDLSGMSDCAAVGAEVTRIDAAIGPDRDLKPLAGEARPSRLARAGSGAVGLIRFGIETVIPYRSLVRRISGAARRQARMEKAIEAGNIRRGYLKGVGMQMNCAPPAAPSWFKPAPPPRSVLARRRARPAPAPPSRPVQLF